MIESGSSPQNQLDLSDSNFVAKKAMITDIKEQPVTPETGEDFIASAGTYMVEAGLLAPEELTLEVLSYLEQVGRTVGIERPIYYNPANGKEIYDEDAFSQLAEKNRPGGQYSVGVMEGLGLWDKLRTSKDAFVEMAQRLAKAADYSENTADELDLAELALSTLEVDVFDKSIFADTSRQSWPDSLRVLFANTPEEELAAFVYHMGLVEMGLDNLVIMKLVKSDGNVWQGESALAHINHLMEQSGLESRGVGGGPKGESRDNPNYTLPVWGTEDGISPFSPQVNELLQGLPTNAREQWLEQERFYWKTMEKPRKGFNRVIRYPNLPKSRVDRSTQMQLHITQIASEKAGFVAMSPHIDIGASGKYHVPIGFKKDFNTGNGLGMPYQLLLMSTLLAKSDVADIQINTHEGAIHSDPSIAIADACMAERHKSRPGPVRTALGLTTV